MIVINHQRRAFITPAIGDFPAVTINPGEAVEFAAEHWNGLHDGIEVIRHLASKGYLEAKTSGETGFVVKEGAQENPPSPKPPESLTDSSDGKIKRTGKIDKSEIEIA